MLADSEQVLSALRGLVAGNGTFSATNTISTASILYVAERMHRIFRLPVPDAPELFLVGGEIDGAVFDPSWKGPLTSVTGTGQDLLKATQSCVCEGVEFLSQLALAGSGFVTGRPESVPSGLPPDSLGQLLTMAGFDASAATPPLLWAQGRSLLRHAPVLLPAALCYRNIRGSAELEPRVKLSSGCGAGASPEAALAHALLELVERDAVALWWLGGRPGRQLDPDVATRLREEVGRESSDRTTWFLDVTTDLAVPCVAALSVDAEGRGLACGFAARFSYPGAARAAFFEMCQMEVGLYLILLKRQRAGDAALTSTDRKYLRRAFGFPVRSCSPLFPTTEGIAAGPPTNASPIESLNDLSLRLASNGVEAFWTDLTRSDLGIPAVRALAPSLQPYPSEIVTPRLQRQIEKTGEGFGRASGIHLM